MKTEHKTYLIRDRGSVKAAHIWTGNDTACRMWSTGGLKKSRGYTLYGHPDGHSICAMCEVVTRGRQEGAKPRLQVDSNERRMKELDRAAADHMRAISAGL